MSPHTSSVSAVAGGKTEKRVLRSNPFKPAYPLRIYPRGHSLQVHRSRSHVQVLLAIVHRARPRAAPLLHCSLQVHQRCSRYCPAAIPSPAPARPAGARAFRAGARGCSGPGGLRRARSVFVRRSGLCARGGRVQRLRGGGRPAPGPAARGRLTATGLPLPARRGRYELRGAT